MKEKCQKVMTDLMRLRTKYTDEKWKALQLNDKEKVKKCNKKLESIDEAIRDLRKLYMK